MTPHSFSAFHGGREVLRRSRTNLVVLALEVGGRPSLEVLTFIRLFFANAKVRSEFSLMRR